MMPEEFVTELQVINPEKAPLHILDLPDEILSNIFSFLTGEELVFCVAPVCEKFSLIIRDDTLLWKSLWLVWDTSKHELCKLLDYVPSIYHLRINHPGSLTEDNLLEILKKTFYVFTDLQSIELECYGTQPSYDESVVQSIVSGLEKKLHLLSIKGPMKQQAITCLCHLSQLTTLKLSQCPNFLGNDLRRVATECSHLEWLSIPRSAYIKDEDLCFFIRLKQNLLTGLELSGYLITDISLQLLSECIHLCHLSLEDSRRLSWGTLSVLCKLSNLQFIRLHRLGAHKKDVLSWISRACFVQHLRVLDLRQGYNVDDEVAMLIADKCYNLRRLYLRNSLLFSNFTCMSIAKSLKYIEDTDMYLIYKNICSTNKKAIESFL